MNNFEKAGIKFGIKKMPHKKSEKIKHIGAHAENAL
jgi:hypothetical protein